MHPCMARGTDTSIDELLRNAKYIRALLSGYSINSPGSKYKNSLGRTRMNFCIDFSSALELFLLELVLCPRTTFLRRIFGNN